MAERRPLVVVSGRLRELPAGDTVVGGGGGGGGITVDALSITYTDGVVTVVTEDGTTTTIAYNADGTVNTVTKGARVETYTYNADGSVASMTATGA